MTTQYTLTFSIDQANLQDMERYQLREVEHILHEAARQLYLLGGIESHLSRVELPYLWDEVPHLEEQAAKKDAAEDYDKYAAFTTECDRVADAILARAGRDAYPLPPFMDLIKELFPAEVERVNALLAGTEPLSTEPSLTESALVAVTNIGQEAHSNIIYFSILSRYDLYKLFGLLASHVTDIDSLMERVQSDLNANALDHLILDKGAMQDALDSLACELGFTTFESSELPKLDKPLKDLSCLAGEAPKAKLSLV